MDKDEFLKQAAGLAAPFRVDDGAKFKLTDFSTDDTGNWQGEGKNEGREALAVAVELIAEYQERLYAEDRRALLVVFQAMDAAGKDGTIRHVFSGVNPQGCHVTAFKSPNAEELDHDFLWRCIRHLPERGRIGVFNRSHYEETLIVRVHPGILAGQKLHETARTKSIWKERFESICDFEKHLHRNGTKVIKFFLNVSKAEQKKRFLERLDEPEKNWKFAAGDIKERGFWDDYQAAYQETIRATATKQAPWFVIPADRKWFARLAVAAAIVETLADMNPALPQLAEESRASLEDSRRLLLSELPSKP